MKDIDVPASRLITTNLVDEGVVSIYAGLIARNIQGIHRIIVADISHILSSMVGRSDRVWYRGRNVCNRKAFSHVVIEGNHRSVAQALFSEDLPCTLLESNDDLEQCRLLSDDGLMCRFVHDENDLNQLVREAFFQGFGGDEPLSASDAAMQLSNIDWPKYIRDKLKMRH
jgi:hypothetical protein